MKRFDRRAASSIWLWPVQIAVGVACIALAIAIAFSPQLGTYTFLILAGMGLMILGGERIAAGIRAQHVRQSSRIINIVIGAGIIVWIGSGFFYPDIAIKYLVLFLGLGLLANGIVRVIDGLRKRNEESWTIFPLGAGVICAAIAVLILVYPPVGSGLLWIMTVIALVVSGIQIVMVGIKGRRLRIDSDRRIAHNSIIEKPRVGSNGIWKKGSWFSDEQGRYLLFRGVNFASRSKLPPYLPIAPLENVDLSRFDLSSEIASVKRELDLLKDLGFNIVRLLISWKAIEPRPNPNISQLLPEGEKYLMHMKRTIDELYARNLYVILDFHQDIAHEVYGGDGFPDWALAIDEEHESPEPSDLKDKKWQIKYAVNKSLKHTLRSFWQNDLTNIERGLENYPVRTHLERTIGQAAKFLLSNNGRGDDPTILGIEPFNEPHPAGLEKEQFEKETLLNYYGNVNSELTGFAPDLFIFIEPRVDWTVSKVDSDSKSVLGSTPFSAKSAFHMGLIKDVMLEGRMDSKKIQTYLPKDLHSTTFGRNGVLSFHFYDMMAVASSFLKIPESMYTYRREWPSIFDQLVRAATERGLIPFLTEFGGYQEAEQVRDYLNLQFEQIEAHLLNATCWNYDLYNTKEGKDNWNLEDYSLLGPNRTPRNIDIVARPYPMRSSAEPVLLFFDVASKYATIILRGRVVDAPTIIYIPFSIHYKPEFTVWATGEEVKWDRENQLLYWQPSKERDDNQIIISKSRQLDADALPEHARKIATDFILMRTFT
ncbi:MAG: cellulase family glycosylhydrolase [Thermoproteota archaeon]